MLKRTLGLVALTLVAGCGDSSAGPEDEEPVPFLIMGGDMGRQHQNVYVSRDGVASVQASVLVNGTVIPQVGQGFFQGPLPSLVPVGGTVSIVVSEGSVTATGTMTAMENPTLVAPLSGSNHPANAPLTVTWTSAENPDEFVVWILYSTAAGGGGVTTPVAGTLRQAIVPTTGVPANATNVQVAVFAYRDGTFTGAADPDSQMRVRAASNQHSITLIP